MMQMRCAWKELLNILPVWMREQVDELGQETMQELRLRIGYPPELNCGASTYHLGANVTQQDLLFTVNTASRYSPWAAQSLSRGYVTAPGGHRLGVCGTAVVKDGAVSGIRDPLSVCIRVSRDFPNLPVAQEAMKGSVLIIGSPGSGKTTLLRGLIRKRSEHTEQSIAVVDERGEVFPEASNFPFGRRTDVLRGCSKSDGLEMLLRTMGPSTIAVDEISSAKDCRSLVNAAWCGVDLIATAHAASGKDLQTRKVYKPLIGCGIFDTLIVMRKDKSWYVERVALV
jgi:stage III sporulation protein AA